MTRLAGTDTEPHRCGTRRMATGRCIRLDSGDPRGRPGQPRESTRWRPAPATGQEDARRTTPTPGSGRGEWNDEAFGPRGLRPKPRAACPPAPFSSPERKSPCASGIHPCGSTMPTGCTTCGATTARGGSTTPFTSTVASGAFAARFGPRTRMSPFGAGMRSSSDSRERGRRCRSAEGVRPVSRTARIPRSPSLPRRTSTPRPSHAACCPVVPTIGRRAGRSSPGGPASRASPGKAVAGERAIVGGALRPDQAPRCGSGSRAGGRIAAAASARRATPRTIRRG